MQKLYFAAYTDLMIINNLKIPNKIHVLVPRTAVTLNFIFE